MRNEEIRPTGINRAIAEQDAPASACEELINMRLENGALRPTGDKELVMEPASGQPDMLRIYVHRVADQYNYIGVYVTEVSSVYYTKVCTLNKTVSGYTVGTELLSISGDGNGLIDIKFINNLMIVASGYDEKIYNFSYHNSGYVQTPGILPDVLLDVTKTDVAAKTGSVEGECDYTTQELFQKYKTMSNISAKDYYQDINAGISYLRRNKDRYESEGFVGVCANFTLYDGTETKPTAPRWFYIGGMPEIIYGNASGQTDNRAMHINMARGKLTAKIGSVTVGGDPWGSTLFGQYKDYIRSINIYCTYPKSLVDLEKTLTGQQASTVERFLGVWVDTLKISQSAVIESRITPTQISATNTSINYSEDFYYEYNNVAELGKELFYKQRSIELKDSLSSMQELVALDFSDAMLTGDTMKVENSGYIDRFGQMDVYNKRLHLFDTKNTLNMPAGDYFSQAMKADIDASHVPTGLQKFPVSVKAVTKVKTDTEDLVTVRSFSSNAFGQLSGGTPYYAWRLYNYDGGGRPPQLLYTKSSNPSVGAYTSRDWGQDWDDDYEITGKSGQVIEIDFNSGEETVSYLRDSTADETDYTGQTATLRYLALRSASTVIDSRAYQMDLYVNYNDTSYYKITLNLVSSDAYNYSMLAARKDRYFMFIHDLVPSDNTPESFEYGLLDLNGRGSTSAEWASIDSSMENTSYRETDVVVVSAANNPTFFPPQQSYRIGGNIIGIAVNSQGVSDVQIGQYPMDVFTDNGVYAMELGSGEVVYGNVVKIADDIAATGGMIPTPFGIAFLQGDGVYLINGRKTTRISVGLDGYVDLDIRKCPQFIKAHGSSRTAIYAWYCDDGEIPTGIPNILYTTSATPQADDPMYGPDEDEGEIANVDTTGSGYVTIDYDEQSYTFTRDTDDDLHPYLIYDIFPFILGEEETDKKYSFREQMAEPENILIGYDNIREELWISDIREAFSYVYSFTERSWHTVTATFDWYNVNYAVISGLMYDITKESHVDGTIRHIQTRPLKLKSEGFKAIERLIARINVNGPLPDTHAGNQMFSMYVYGSRDLRNWYMIGASQYKGYTPLLQIGKTSSKFKAFIVTMGGNLTKGSEISPLQLTIGDFYTEKLR